MNPLKFILTYYCLATFLFAGILSSCAQEQPYESVVLVIEGEVTDYFNPELKLNDVEVDIIQNEKVIYSQKTKDGKYLLGYKMDVSVPFSLRFSKQTYLVKGSSKNSFFTEN
jgi:hypothetical protein